MVVGARRTLYHITLGCMYTRTKHTRNTLTRVSSGMHRRGKRKRYVRRDHVYTTFRQYVTRPSDRALPDGLTAQSRTALTECPEFPPLSYPHLFYLFPSVPLSATKTANCIALRRSLSLSLSLFLTSPPLWINYYFLIGLLLWNIKLKYDHARMILYIAEFLNKCVSICGISNWIFFLSTHFFLHYLLFSHRNKNLI